MQCCVCCFEASPALRFPRFSRKCIVPTREKGNPKGGGDEARVPYLTGHQGRAEPVVQPAAPREEVAVVVGEAGESPRSGAVAVRTPGTSDAPAKVPPAEDHDAAVRRGSRLVLGGQPEPRVMGDVPGGREAVKRALSPRPVVVVISDVTVPVMGGPEAPCGSLQHQSYLVSLYYCTHNSTYKRTRKSIHVNDLCQCQA
jgi:hypothetical protein